MPSSKAARGTPRKYTTEEIQASLARNSWCEPCQRDLGNKGGLGSHTRLAHGPGSKSDQVAHAPEPRPGLPVEQADAPALVTFYCRKAPQMRIIFDPARKRNNNATGETELTEGIDIQFDGGVYRTDDEQIIAFLEGDEEAARRLGMVSRNRKVRVYKDPRYPIVSSRQLDDAAKMRQVHAASAEKPIDRPSRGNEFVPSPIIGEGFKGSLLGS